MSGSALREALLKIDYSILNLSLIEVVKNAAPTNEEIEQFINFHPTNFNELALPDLLYLEICNVPQLNNRILAV